MKIRNKKNKAFKKNRMIGNNKRVLTKNKVP